jgi:hypothetical protein
MRGLRNIAIGVVAIVVDTADVVRRHCRSPAGAEPAVEIIYHLRKTVSLDGRVAGEPIDRLGGGVDSRPSRRSGAAYQIEADASQEEDGGDVA